MAARRALLLALVALVALLGAATTVAPASAQADPGPTIVLFHGEGCPHCAAERAFLADLVAAHPQVTVVEHEVWYDAANRALLQATAERLGFSPTGVPVTVIGDRWWIGFDEGVADEIEAAATRAPGITPVEGTTVRVPLLGDVLPQQVSLLAATLAIGFVDGINPCSLWVLSLLLAMVLNRGTRGRVALIGGVFLAVTAGMYGLYMLALYSATSLLRDSLLDGAALTALRVVIAAVCAVFGVLQLTDGLGRTAGPSLSISPGQRPGLYARMRQVASPERALAATLAGTIVLAVAVSLLETPCTAGLPLLWTSLLAANGVSGATALALFAVYLVVFLLDELVVFGVAVVALRATRLQERHGRLLKLVAGSVLVVLAATMLIAPQTLATVTGTVVVFAVALGLAAVLYVSTSGRSTSATSTSAASSTSRTTE